MPAAGTLTTLGLPAVPPANDDDDDDDKGGQQKSDDDENVFHVDGIEERSVAGATAAAAAVVGSSAGQGGCLTSKCCWRGLNLKRPLQERRRQRQSKDHPGVAAAPDPVKRNAYVAHDDVT